MGKRVEAPMPNVCEPTMNKPSERIVVFVSTAQKRAISATAEKMGISVSELMRRAVLSFGATSEQVKAASIVDRLHAPRAPDALDAALQRVARGTRYARAALPPSLQSRPTPAAGDDANAVPTASISAGESATPASPPPPPLLPADVLAALTSTDDEDAIAIAEAVARVARAEAAASVQASATPADTQGHLLSVFKRPRLDNRSEPDDPQSDPSTEGGHFA